MSNDNRDTLEVLKAELDFIEKGGYGRSVRTPWKSVSIFRDSPTCLNFADPERPHPCSSCSLIDFVPEEASFETVPCHYIPLDETGVTVETLRIRGDERELQEAVSNWIHKQICRLGQSELGRTSFEAGRQKVEP